LTAPRKSAQTALGNFELPSEGRGSHTRVLLKSTDSRSLEVLEKKTTEGPRVGRTKFFKGKILNCFLMWYPNKINSTC
jgi:hypothetical protein